MFDIMLGTADADFYGHQSQHGSFVFGSDSGLKNRLINRLTICAQHRLLLQRDAARLWDTFRNWQMPKLSAHGAAGVICALTAYRLSTV